MNLPTVQDLGYAVLVHVLIHVWEDILFSSFSKVILPKAVLFKPTMITDQFSPEMTKIETPIKDR